MPASISTDPFGVRRSVLFPDDPLARMHNSIDIRVYDLMVGP
jgi:hypothetical protein